MLKTFNILVLSHGWKTTGAIPQLLDAPLRMGSFWRAVRRWVNNTA